MRNICNLEPHLHSGQLELGHAPNKCGAANSEESARNSTFRLKGCEGSSVTAPHARTVTQHRVTIECKSEKSPAMRAQSATPG